MAVFISALHPRESVFENPATEVLLHLFFDNRPKKAVFLLVFLVVHSLEINVGLAEYAVNRSFSRPALTVGPHCQGQPAGDRARKMPSGRGYPFLDNGKWEKLEKRVDICVLL